MRLGISIYPEIVGKEATIEYINLAKENGFSRIFANLLEIKDDAEGKERLEMISSVYKYARSKGFEVIVDVNPSVYKEFNLENTEIDFFRNLNVSGIRLDEDFKGDVESILTNNQHNFKIELNASSGTETIDLTLQKGGDPENLIACHNFYPMRYTGLDRERFVKLSSYFKAKGITVAAFITLPEDEKNIGPWNVNNGMPTLEEHRDMSIEEQIIDFIQIGDIDDIIISQQGATEEDFKRIKKIIDQIEDLKVRNIVEVRMEENKGSDIENEIIFNNQGNTHFNRPDYTSYFVRSTMSRIYYKDSEIKQNNLVDTLKVGDVVILNETKGRYKGELHIITKEMDNSEGSRNLVGRIAKEDLWKLKFIKGGVKFKIWQN